MTERSVVVRLRAELGGYRRDMDGAAQSTRRLRTETEGAGNATEELTRSARKSSEAWKKAGAVVGGLLIADKITDFARASIQAAADAQQSIGSVDAVFKQNAKVVQDWAKSASRDVGLSRNTYRELATLIGSQLKNAGVSLDELGAKTNDVIKIGADLSAMYGGTASDAVEALSSALKGEMDPIEKYGISLNQAALQQEALTLGLVKGKEQMSQAAKAQAILSLVTKQGADANGAFASEADTLAHKQQVLAARVDDLKESLGDKLLPVMDAGLTTVSGIADAFGALPKPLQYTVVGVTALGTAAVVGVPKIVAFKAAVASLGTTAAVTTTELEGTAAAAAATSRAGSLAGFAKWGGSAARALGPIGLLLGSMTAVAAFADSQSRKQHEDAVNGLVGDPKKLDEARRKYEELVTARDATMRQSADIAVGSTKQAYAAAYAYQGQAGAAKELDSQVREAEKALRDQAIASGDAGLAAQAGASLQEQLAAATNAQKQATEQATAAVKKYQDGLNALLAPYVTLPQAMSTFEESLDALTKKQLNAKGAFEKGKTAINLNTEAGRKLQDVLLSQITSLQSVADATFKQTGSVDKANKAWNDGRDRIIENLEAMGLSKTQAEKLTGQFGLLKDAVKNVPGAKDVKTTATGAKTATDQIRDLREQIALLEGKTVNIRLNVGRYRGKNIPLADGGYVSGPGGPRDDKIPAMLSDGEFVVNAAATARNRGLLEHINAQKFAAGGYVQHFATGGSVTSRIEAQYQKAIRLPGAEGVQAAADAITRLLAAWQKSIDDADTAARRLELVRAVAKASRKDVAEARKALADFDRDQTRERIKSAAAAKQDLLASRAKALQDRQADADKQASDLNRMLDERTSILGQLAQAQATYDATVAATNARLAQQTAQLKASRTAEIAGWADLTQQVTVGFAPSMRQLLANGKDQVEQLTEWISQLGQARASGLSEAAIAALGLDKGPQALAQLRQVNKSTADQVDQMNALVAQRTDLAAQQADTEATNRLGKLGQDLLALQQEATQAIADAQASFMEQQQALTEQLAAIGTDQARSYTDAIAEGLTSGIPAIEAAAAQVQAALVKLGKQQAALTAATKKATTKRAGGGWVFGPGSSTSDEVALMASNGEFVVNAAAARRNAALLTAINSGRTVTAGQTAGVSASSVNVAAPVVQVFLGDQPLEGLVRVVLRQTARQAQMAARRTVGA